MMLRLLLKIILFLSVTLPKFFMNTKVKTKYKNVGQFQYTSIK